MEIQKLNNQNLIQEYKNLGTPNSLLNKVKTECKTWQDIFTSQHKTIGQIARMGKTWQQFVCSYIATTIVDYLEFVAREKTMNEKQIAETAILILEQKQNLKIDDICFFFKLCKTAHFGKLYDLNGQVIFDWLNEYQNQKKENFFNYQQERIRRYKQREEEKQKLLEATQTQQQKEQQQKKMIAFIQKIKNRKL